MEQTAHQPRKSFKQVVLLALVALLIVGIGLFTGRLLSGKSGSQGAGGQVGEEIGSQDTQIFKDTASGVLEKGGLDGDGTHRLLREGGPSQTAYLTSSVIDLDQFVGKKIKVWGKTFQGQKASWLMDVGRVKILE